MDLVEQVRDFAASNLSDDKFVVEALVSEKKNPKRVLVIIDGDRGITIDDCAELSRVLSKEFEEKELFGDENYLLEVSTPGLDQPLKMKRQYFKNTGRSLKVTTSGGTIEGRLKEVTDEKIVLVREIGVGKKKETNETEIPFTEIEKTFVLASFK